MYKILFFLFMFVSATTNCFAKVRVIDGDSIVANGVETRLIGIDAPEHQQICFDEDRLAYDCGEDSKIFLKELVKGKKVVCNKIAKDIYKRDLSECFADDKNVNIELLKSGQAVLYKSKNVEYKRAEKEARKNKIGVWKGRFVRPEFHRVLKRK